MFFHYFDMEFSKEGTKELWQDGYGRVTPKVIFQDLTQQFWNN